MRKHKRGFTLIELLIAVSIILLLSMFVFINLRGQSARANDSRRKTDLFTLRKAFEEYYNDNEAFPEQSVVDTCGGSTLVPYLQKIPCDPSTKNPYGYFLADNGGYRICAKLADTTDIAIAALHCDGPEGCGVGGGYNYCLTSGVTASAVGTGDQIVIVTPTLDPDNHWACTAGGDCNWYDDPGSEQHSCPISWLSQCPGYISNPKTSYSGECGIPANLCAD